MGRPGTRKTRNPKNVKIRYAVFTEGLVTERQYLELLYQQIRPKHATIKIHAIGGEPSRVLKECNKALRKDDFDHAILIVDVDQHQRLDEVLTSCRNSSEVDAIVSNPCFELWLLWHTQNQTGYIESRGCVNLAHRAKVTDEKALTTQFPHANYEAAIERARKAWPGLTPNEKGPNPSAAMPWFIDLLVSPPKEK